MNYSFIFGNLQQSIDFICRVCFIASSEIPIEQPLLEFLKTLKNHESGIIAKNQKVLMIPDRMGSLQIIYNHVAIALLLFSMQQNWEMVTQWRLLNFYYKNP